MSFFSEISGKGVAWFKELKREGGNIILEKISLFLTFLWAPSEVFAV